MREITTEYLASQGLSKTFPRRFWSKVRKTEGCWIWTGSLTTTFGYGWIGRGTRSQGSVKAHVGSWIINIGPVPAGLRVLHHCDNPACVRPDHLWLGTQKDNIRDSVKKARMAVGHINNMAKLNEHQVIEIRNKYATEKITKTALGRFFSVSRSCIYAIVNHVNWSHIT